MRPPVRAPARAGQRHGGSERGHAPPPRTGGPRRRGPSHPARRPAQRLDLVLTTTTDRHSATRLAPATINRIFAAVSSFYEYLIVSGRWSAENPIQQRPDPALARVSERHRAVYRAGQPPASRSACGARQNGATPAASAGVRAGRSVAWLVAPVAGPGAGAVDAAGWTPTWRGAQPAPGRRAIRSTAGHRPLSN